MKEVYCTEVLYLVPQDFSNLAILDGAKEAKSDIRLGRIYQRQLER